MSKSFDLWTTAAGLRSTSETSPRFHGTGIREKAVILEATRIGEGVRMVTSAGSPMLWPNPYFSNS